MRNSDSVQIDRITDRLTFFEIRARSGWRITWTDKLSEETKSRECSGSGNQPEGSLAKKESLSLPHGDSDPELSTSSSGKAGRVSVERLTDHVSIDGDGHEGEGGVVGGEPLEERESVAHEVAPDPSMHEDVDGCEPEGSEVDEEVGGGEVGDEDVGDGLHLAVGEDDEEDQDVPRHRRHEDKRVDAAECEHGLQRNAPVHHDAGVIVQIRRRPLG